MNHRILRAALALVVVAVLILPATVDAVEPTLTDGRLTASDHTCALTTEGGVRCWGDNSAGGLGDGTTTSSSTPVDVVGLASGAIAIVAGDRYSCALTSAGGVKCWGYNEFGQLGDATMTDRPTPVDVTGLTSGVTAITARGEHTCALITGAVTCWGANVNGQLGDGTTTTSGTPVDVRGLTSGVRAVAVGGEHTCAITSDGGVRCWGWNATGQLGIGTTADSDMPVDVSGLASGVSAIAAGGRHTCALLTAGGVRCWGYDEFGQLGDGATTDRSEPVDVARLTGTVTAITAGGNDACALMSDGRVTCWGIDLTDQPGDGLALVDVAGLGTGITAVVAGYYHICGITRTGGVTCWGGNDTGQLGNGTTIDSPTPVDVSNADGMPLITVGATDVESPSLPLPAIAVVVAVVAVVVILAGGLYLKGRRRAP